MRKLGIHSDSGGDRGARTRLRNQMKRLFNATIQMTYEDDRGMASMTSPIASHAELWWDPRQSDQLGLWESKIRLGEDFFNEIIAHPVPLDMNTLKALTRSPLGLDLYLWLVYRTFALATPLRLSWQQVYRQFGTDPDSAGDNRTVQDFRKDCMRELKKIKAAWPELNYSMARGMLILHPSKPAIPPSTQTSASR